MSIPTANSLLVPYSTNFNARLVADAADFGLLPAQAVIYTGLHNSYISAQAAVASPGSRTKALVTARNDAKKLLLDYARELYAFVQANTSVSNENKELLGVKIRKFEPSPSPIPQFAPAIEILSVVGTRVRIRLKDSQTPSRRGRPPGTLGALVISHIGPEAPPDPSQYKAEGNTGKTVVDIVFPADTAPGAQVFVAAAWFNGAKKSGPTCMPVGTTLQGGGIGSGLAGDAGGGEEEVA